MKNKWYTETVCCSCAHKYDTRANEGIGEIACDSCDGSRNLVPTELYSNCIKCTTKTCVNNGRYL